ncbi:MAG TPA: acireductone synthase [Thermoanaerobaculia bacterium]|nr:acireductone synthase [Thermoanaerobaculia bacterium]
MPLPDGLAAVLLDVEGTTTPLSFVSEVLFPYAAERLPGFLARRRGDPEVNEALRALAEEHRRESAAEGNAPPAFGDGLPFVRYLMAADRKSPGLKLLQGLVWREGYAAGEIRGQVFDDVPPALRAWRRAGLRLRVFSSGSVLAQRLLFSTTSAGDLTPLFEGFHDTGTGPKHEPGSYRGIAEAFGLEPRRILFLSDTPAELDAATVAGLDSRLAERPGNRPVAGAAYPRVRSFEALTV